MPKKSPSSPSPAVDDESRAGLAFDRTLDRRESSAATPAAVEPAAGQPANAAPPIAVDPGLAPTQDGSNPPRRQLGQGKSTAERVPPAEQAAMDKSAAEPSQPAIAEAEPAGEAADADEEDDEVGSTRSIGAVRSGAAASAPRSAPSVPYVGIPRSLQKWDRYEVQSVLGAGGMGAVYKARDPRLNRMVALKIIHPMLGQNDDTRGEGVVRRFLREARLQASLEHPHICKVYEIGELPTADGEASYPYICMQLIAGRPLHRAQDDMSLFEKVRVIQQVAEALHSAHKQGLIHRDIKPSNIMVERTPDGAFHPYVMDFGLARETAGDQSRTGIIEGTPRYMAPEQARGDTKHLDRRTDVYALGVTLYELLAQKPPYAATGDMDTLLAVIAAEPTPLRKVDAQIPADLEAITLKCLEKEQSARYDSAKALADDLGRYLDGEPVKARHIGIGQRLLRRARKHKPLVALATALLLSLSGLIAYGVRTRIVAAERDRAAREQARLAQNLGQQIAKMEWLLRSARQLPLHDLGREKALVRIRMHALSKELQRGGTLASGLSHYALGRGHLALHEYPDALNELLAALRDGVDAADVHYALGLVRGKLYELAMYEARLAGGGDWADKQLKDLEPKFLLPAIDSLQKSRAFLSDSPAFLEALIAFYQRDFDRALASAEKAQAEAPWLYEGYKLMGDVLLERALKARDSGKYDDAEKLFADSVRRFEQAADIGRSDSEVYEGLAEAWVRLIEMDAGRGKNTELAYAKAVSAADRATQAEPDRIRGRLKKGYAALLTSMTLGTGQSAADRVKTCLDEMQGVLLTEPDNPYARDVAAGCSAFTADAAQGRGENPEPLIRKAIALLEPAVQKHPRFLWGLNDLAVTYTVLGMYQQLHGNPEAKALFEKTLLYERDAAALDPTYLIAQQNILLANARLLSFASSGQAIDEIVTRATAAWQHCTTVNPQFQQCHINFLTALARAAERLLLGRLKAEPLLSRAKSTLDSIRKIGGQFLDAEQYAALTELLQARVAAESGTDPTAALAALAQTLQRCLAIADKDAFCRTLAAQAQWVRADFDLASGKNPLPALGDARNKAADATQSPEPFPDAWFALAESHRRLFDLPALSEKERAAHADAVNNAVDKCLAINPHHPLCLNTSGLLALAQAKRAPAPADAKSLAARAAHLLESATKADSLLLARFGQTLTEAQTLARAP